MKNFLLALLSLTVLNLKAQTTKSLPAVYEIKTDTVGDYTFDSNHWQLLVDMEAKYTIEQASAMPFTIIKGQYGHFAPSAKAYWMRYRIKNTLNHPVIIYIPEEAGVGLGALSVNHAEVYMRVQGGAWKHHITGAMVPWSQITDYKRVPGFYFTLQPAQEYTFYETVYNGVEGSGGTAVMIRIVKSVPDALVKQYEAKMTRNNSAAFFLGFTLVAGLISLFFFYSSREKVYLYFGLGNLFYGFSRFGVISVDWFFKDTPSIGYVYTLSVVTAFYFLARFSFSFYQTRLYFPKWTWFCMLLTNCLIPIFFLSFFPIHYALTSLAGIISMSFAGNLFFIIIFSIFKNRRELLYNALTILPLVLLTLLTLGFLIASLVVKKDLAVTYTTSNLMAAAYCWVAIMFLLKLVMRYKVLQQKILAEALEREKLARDNEIEKNRLIENQKIELEQQVAERTAELSASLANLKQTQAQLVQAEKMASLGELTAGIAHEIQNPLNFVNNFSDVSAELIDELDEELDKGDIGEAKLLASGIKQNLEKINHHGKRADNIVKGMLEHSRVSSGQKEPTDMNKLVDEYLRLAYHGLRAKDKTFNAELITHLDKNLPLIKAVPQDMGRVMLNLFTNAFYAVQQKQKTTEADYKPRIEITTKAEGQNAVIIVKDNGTGIPDAIKDKIMQPFFTTKPTGQGTGLGLSLSYDVIVKGHGGAIDMSSETGEGTTFMVSLPM